MDSASDPELTLEGLAMPPTRSLPRRLPIVLAAIVAALLAADVASASTVTSQDRTAKMKRDGCCCPRPLQGGCCCEPAPAVAPSDETIRPTTIGQVSVATLRL